MSTHTFPDGLVDSTGAPVYLPMTPTLSLSTSLLLSASPTDDDLVDPISIHTPCKEQRDLNKSVLKKQKVASSSSPKQVVPSPSKEQQPDYDHLRQNLVDIYQCHAPHKLDIVDATLLTVRGREAAFIDQVERKYKNGGHSVPPPSSPVLNRTSQVSGGYRHRLVNLYYKYAPEKLPTVDATLKRVAGREEQFLELVESKYKHQQRETTMLTGAAELLDAKSHTAATKERRRRKKSPISSSDYRTRLVNLYRKCAPDKVSSVDKTLQHVAGNEEKFLQLIEAKYEEIDRVTFEELYAYKQHSPPSSVPPLSNAEQDNETHRRSRSDKNKVIKREKANSTQHKVGVAADGHTYHHHERGPRPTTHERGRGRSDTLFDLLL